jgi:DNA-binding SARP family transcriptional activator
MDFRILGSLEVWDGERQLELGGSKRRAVLALLLLHANEVVALDRLVDQLWGEKAPRNAAAAIRTHVSRLRKELGPEVVATRAWGYVLRTEPGGFDLERFERLRAEAESLPARERAEKLREALALYRGPPLEDIAFEPGLAADIGRLEELRLTVLENRIDADLEAGNQSGLVGELEALIAEHPLRERLRGQLILALYRGGRQAEALEVYRETRRVLADELGLEPSPELRELERAILQHDPALRPSPMSGAVVAEPGVRPGRRRRVIIGAFLALLLAGLGAATAYSLSRTTTALSQPPTEVVTVLAHSTGQTTTSSGQTGTTTGNSKNGGGAGHTTTATGRPPKHKTGTNGTHGVSNGSAHRTTTTGRTITTTHTGPTHKGGSGHRPQPVRIADGFSRTALNLRIWKTWGTGTGVSYVQTSGQGVFSIAADATFDPIDNASSNIGTKCLFPGNFDARINFVLSPWPPGNGAAISFQGLAGVGYSVVELIRRVTASGGDGYGAWPEGSAAGVLPFPDDSGRLRLTRSHGIIRALFSHNGHWKEIGHRRFEGDIRVDLNVGTFQGDWQGQDVSAAVDNFTLTAADAKCPARSDPRGR